MPDEKPITEAQIEAGVSHAIRHAFPFISAVSIRHQLSFTIRLGRRTITVDGKSTSKATGRCDILLVHDDRPLAILELKRPGLPLTDNDRRQGLSYARLTEPWAPLVIVTNGTGTQLFSTFTGEVWKSECQSEQALADLIHQTTKLADSDLRNAVEVLIGPQSAVWMELVRSISRSTLDDLTGEWGDTLLPFSKGLHFPRKASGIVYGLIEHGAPCVLVTGAPLSGKSNVLREIVDRSFLKDDPSSMFLDAGASGHWRAHQQRETG